MSLETNVSSAFTRVATEFKTLRTGLTGNNSGSLTGLTTTAKTSLVAAINELDAAIEALDGEIDTAIAAAIAGLIDSAPGALNTLNELAAAMGDDPTFATTITNQLAGKAPTVHTHTASQVTDLNTAIDTRVPAATATAAGKVELATDAETIAGTDTSRAITPANLLAAVGNTATNYVTVFETGLV